MRRYDKAYCEWMRRKQLEAAHAVGDFEPLKDPGCRARPPRLAWTPLPKDSVFHPPAGQKGDEQEAQAVRPRNEFASLALAIMLC